MNAEEMRAALEAAFEKRGMLRMPQKYEKALGDPRLWIDAKISTLLSFAAPGLLLVERQKVVLRSLRRSAVKEAQRELDRVANAAEKYVVAIDALRYQATAALAKAGVLNINHEPFLQAVRAVAAKARTAKALIEAKGGLEHPRDLRSQSIAGTVAGAYEEIWGGNASLPGQTPGLEKLIEEVFDILGIRTMAGRRPNARAALRAALKQRENLKTAS
jgi:hypothetical protein